MKAICTIVLVPFLSASLLADTWDLKPLGDLSKQADYSSQNSKSGIRKEPWRKEKRLAGAPIVLTRENRVLCAIVLPDAPSRSVKKAGEEMAQALTKVAGSSAVILNEKDLSFGAPDEEGHPTISDGKGNHYESAIFIGPTKLAKAKGIRFDDLPPEGFRIATQENLIFIVGQDQAPSRKATAGTLNGVIDLLESQLGFRWLWPGESGEIIPETHDLKLAAMEITDAPLLKMRRMRNSGSRASRDQPYETDEGTKEAIPAGWSETLRYLGQRPETFVSHQNEASAWFWRSRLGASLPLGGAHAFNGWFPKYGDAHPEWFALQANGSRKQSSPRERLCKANEGLIHQVAANVLENAAGSNADPISICPNDGSTANSFCMCETCRGWDIPEGAKIRFGYRDAEGPHSSSYVSLSDRISRFYSEVAKEVAQSSPGQLVTGYAYSHYRNAPLATKLHDNVVIGFVGFTYIDDVLRQRDQKNWQGWSKSAGALFLRPNFFHAGHGYPLAYPNRVAEDLRRCYETGMIGADFDSVLHHWSTHGLNYYVVSRLLWNPYADPHAIVHDYCTSGFGPAAEPIKAYFADLEKVTETIARSARSNLEGELRQEEELETNLSYQEIHAVMAKAFTLDQIAALRKHLEEARIKAAESTTVLERIRFLAAGLDYAEAQARFGQAQAEDPATLRKKANERLEAFKKIYSDHYFAIGFRSILSREGGTLKRLHGKAGNP